MSPRILRSSLLHRTKKGEGLLGVGPTHFHEQFVFHDEADPFVPDTEIPRLRKIPLGCRAYGFASDEVDALIAALRKLRDTGRAA